jgi:hypothetical protein
LPAKNSIPFLSFFQQKFVSVVESIILPPNYPDRFSPTVTKINSRVKRKLFLARSGLNLW